ncbi:GNAT family N-acetyltransferase [Longispora albida]|uniref:GNAT family N-acetyltransferase n=1 Tax=Longispora albida TaxID=203523 RepID=UPI00035DCA6E|nr:GNAT family N-acetyltransferase [Longispora albida]
MTVFVAEATRVSFPGPPLTLATAPEAERLGQLYFECYEPGVAWATEAEAIADIRLGFDGGYGPLWPEATLFAEADGRPVAAVYTVHRAPWPDTPDCPFVIDLHVSRAYRRQGLASRLLGEVLSLAAGTDRPRVALRVDPANEPAILLYTALGFRPA